MKFLEILKRAFTTNIPLKLAALGLTCVMVILINAL